MSMQNGSNKKAIVVGATSGIGKAVVAELSKLGWEIGIAGRRQGLLQEIQRKNLQVVATEQIDINADNAGEKLTKLIGKTGGMDLYFHASGIGFQNVDLDEAIELSTVTTNGLGFTRMVGAAYRYMAAHGGGHIAAISSIAGTKGLGAAPAYSATKAYQNTYLQALEQQACIRRLNIRFTDIRPGFVGTDLLNGLTGYPMLLKKEKVAREIVWALEHRRHIRVIDWRWRIVTAGWRCIPNFIWRRLPLTAKTKKD